MNNNDILARPKEVKIGLLFLTAIIFLLLIISPFLSNLFYKILFPNGYTGETWGGTNYLGFFVDSLIIVNLIIPIIVGLFTKENLAKRIQYGISTFLHGILITGVLVILRLFFLSPH